MPEPITAENTEQASPVEVNAEEVAQETSVSANNSEAQMDEVLDRLLGSDNADHGNVPDLKPTAPDADYEKAIKALQRDGVPSDVIDSLKSNPSKMKEWGLKAAKRQADVDAFGSKVADSKKQNKSEEPKNSAKSDDMESDADPLSEFSNMFGEDAAKPLRQMQDRYQKELENRTNELNTRFESQLAYMDISREYGSNAPDIANVLETASQLGRENPKSFASIKEIIRASFVKIAGQPKKNDIRDLARPSVGKAVPRAVRQVDKEDLALDILLSGGNRDDVRRVISR